MDHAQKADISLARHVEVGEALRYLARQLGCDNWYVACHHEHVFVFRLTFGSMDKFAVRMECNTPVEKGVYHGCKAWSLAITPLHHEAGLALEQVKSLERGLSGLNQC